MGKFRVQYRFHLLFGGTDIFQPPAVENGVKVGAVAHGKAGFQLDHKLHQHRQDGQGGKKGGHIIPGTVYPGGEHLPPVCAGPEHKVVPVQPHTQQQSRKEQPGVALQRRKKHHQVPAAGGVAGQQLPHVKKQQHQKAQRRTPQGRRKRRSPQPQKDPGQHQRRGGACQEPQQQILIPLDGGKAGHLHPEHQQHTEQKPRRQPHVPPYRQRTQVGPCCRGPQQQ